MRHQRVPRAQLRLWALLTLAFVMVGVSAGIAILNLSLDRYQRDFRSELVNLANVTSMAVDPEVHEQLQRPDQMNSALYRQEIDKLAHAKQLLSGVRYIYTLRKGPAGYVFILDPTPPGDHDADGTDDKSYLGDPYPEMPMEAKTAYEHGVVTVESEPTHDRWGSFISAFAPIRDKSGKVIAILGIDRLANDLEEHQRDLLRAVGVGLAFVVLMGIFFGWAFSRKISTSGDGYGWLRYLTGSTRIFRATMLELALGGLSLIVLFGALESLAVHQRTVAELQGSTKRAGVLMQLDAKVGEISQHPTLEGLKQAQEQARQADLAWLYARFEELIHGPQTDHLAEDLQTVKNQIAADFEREVKSQGYIQSSIHDQTMSLITLFIVSALLAFGAIAIVRLASNQQQDLIAARTDSERHQVAYRQVAENLPVGLYVYHDGQITFSNEAWDRQCRRDGGEDRLEALQRALEPTSGQEFIDRLREAEASGTSFTAQYRLVNAEGVVQILETQVVSSRNKDNEVECLLGFTVDQTHRLLTQEELATKNREVQQKNRMLSRAINDLEDNFEAMLQTLVKAVEAKCIYTAGHSDRVMRYSLAIADRLHLSASEIKTLRIGALLHDVGKIGVPDEILVKPGPLEPEELRIIQAHAVNGALMVETIPAFKECLPIVRWHHERLDGSGYPDGLRGEEIPLLVRIASIADCFDAMTSTRPYREALSMNEAIEELRRMANQAMVNPELVEILAETVMDDLTFESESKPAA